MMCSPHVFGKIAIEVSPILDRPKYILMLVICRYCIDFFSACNIWMIMHPHLVVKGTAHFPWAARLRKKTSGLGVFKPGRWGKGWGREEFKHCWAIQDSKVGFDSKKVTIVDFRTQTCGFHENGNDFINSGFNYHQEKHIYRKIDVSKKLEI